MKKANEMAKVAEQVRAKDEENVKQKVIDFIEKNVAPVIEKAAAKGENTIRFQKDASIDSTYFKQYLEENGYITYFAYGIWCIGWQN